MKNSFITFEENQSLETLIMKKKVFLLIVLFTTISFAQKKDINFKTTKTDNKLIFICVNSSKTAQEVTLTFSKVKGLGGYKKPITKIVPAKKEINFTELIIKGAYSYNFRFNFKPFYSKEDEEKILKKLKEKELKEISNLNKGIVVFSQKGCSRCKYTNNFLIENNIEYSYLNTTNNEDNSRLMWSVLKENNYKGENVKMPVILVDGELFTDLKNLKKFLSSLKSKL